MEQPTARTEAEAETAQGAEHADVVIIGAGPVGLMLAIELCLGGVRPVVLDRLPEISQIPKGNGLIGQIVPVLAYRGLLDRLAAGATYAGPTPQFSFGPLRLELASLGASPVHILAIPQRRLEQRLDERLRELGGSVRRGHEVGSLAADSAGVTLTVTGPAGQYQVRAAYLVGCDGARSMVRKQAGIAFPGYTSTEISRIGRVTLPTAVLHARRGEVEIPGAGRLRLTEFVRTPTGSYAIGWQRSLDADAPPRAYIVSTREDGTGAERPRERGASDPETPMDLAEFSESVRRVVGADIPMTEPSWLTRVVGNSRQADRYQAGRVLLAGDAAHVFGVGGGLNTGLLDAMNLGWKLAATVAGTVTGTVAGVGAGTGAGTARGQVPEGVLASYHTERHAAAKRTLLQTRAQRALSADGEPAAALRELVAELLRYPDALRHVGELLEGADVRYEMPAAGDRPHPLVGRLAPDLWLQVRGDGLRARSAAKTSVAELMRTAGWVLLDFTEDGRAAARAAGWNGHVSLLNARQLTEPAVADALLIRPDGYVAWASGPRAADPAARLRNVLAAWLG